MTSLNPAYTVGEQIIETLVRHRGLTRAQARACAIELLRDVRIPSPEQRVDEYPAQALRRHASARDGRHRAGLRSAATDRRRADNCARRHHSGAGPRSDTRPQEEDERGDCPDFARSRGDCGICDEVAVMYAGEIVEHAPVDALFRAPQHPYTIGLLASIPRLDRRVKTLATIEGSLPDMSEIPQGCRFAPRCPFAARFAWAARHPSWTSGQGIGRGA